MAREIGKDVEEAIVVTTADRLRAEGYSQGLIEGRIEGLIEGEREVFLKQLEKLFGALPEDAVARVNAAGHTELDAWIDRLFTAATLAEVLGEP